MNERPVVAAVVRGLVAAILVALVGGVSLSATDHPVPSELWQLATGALGALAALLASTSTVKTN